MVKKSRKVSRKTRRRPNPIRELVREGQVFMAGVDRRIRRMRRNLRILPRGINTRSQTRKTKPITHPMAPIAPKASKKRREGLVIDSSSSSESMMVPEPKQKNTVKPRAPLNSALGSTIPNNNVGKRTQLKKTTNQDAMIPAYGFIDVCFCVDATGSMWSEIEQVKEVIQSIIHNIENKVRTEGLTLRFAVVTYRDHPPQDHSYVTKFNDFTDNFETIAYVKTLSAGGGGDEPEAVHDGLLVSAKELNWVNLPGTPVLRYIFHIADAPPHGSEFTGYESKKGCLCGLQTDDVIREINIKQIHYRLIKVRNNPRVDKMEEIFKSKVADFDSTQIQHAKEMNVKVSDMIIHEVLPDFA